MRQYPLSVKIAAWLIISLECFILLGILGYVTVMKYEGRMDAVSVSRIDKNNIMSSPSGNLKHFYEWSINQTITHERTWLPHSVIATTNDDGLISDGVSYEVDKPKGVYRIIAIGDSFTEGPFVEPSFTYPKQLETKLNAISPCPMVTKYEVLNFGVGGYDIEYAAHRLITRGAKYQPDLILWFLKNDDFIQRTDTDREKEIEYGAYVRDELGGDIRGFTLFQKYAEEFSGVAGDMLSQIHGIVVREQMDSGAYIKNFSAQDEVVKRVVMVMQTPIILKTFSDTDPKFKARMKFWSNLNHNMYFYDDIPGLRPGTETFEPNDGHPNKEGYAIIADTALKNIIRHDQVCQIKD